MSDPSDASEQASDAAEAADAPPIDAPPPEGLETAEAASPELAELQSDNQPLVDRRKKAVLGVPIEVVISVGKARPLLSELVGLRRDSVLMLDSKIEVPVEIMVGDRVIARGELQEIDSETGRLCVRLTEVADLSQSL